MYSLLSASLCSKCFAYSNSLNPHNNLFKYVLLLPPFYKEISQLGGSRAGSQTQAIWLQCPHAQPPCCTVVNQVNLGNSHSLPGSPPQIQIGGVGLNDLYSFFQL